MNPHCPVLPLRRRLAAAALVAAAVTAVSVLSAQQIWVGDSGYTRPRSPIATDFDGGFMFCRGLFRGGWSTDYPGADHNFSVRLAELTRIPVKFDPNRQPHHVVVSLTLAD